MWTMEPGSGSKFALPSIFRTSLRRALSKFEKSPANRPAQRRLRTQRYQYYFSCGRYTNSSMWDAGRTLGVTGQPSQSV